MQRQLGNAVPSLIAETLGREILRQFFGRKSQAAPKLTVKPQRPIPPPELVRPVPRKYKRPPKEDVADYVPRYLQKHRTAKDGSLIDAV